MLDVVGDRCNIIAFPIICILCLSLKKPRICLVYVMPLAGLVMVQSSQCFSSAFIIGVL